jgi:hypothetical protein
MRPPATELNACKRGPHGASVDKQRGKNVQTVSNTTIPPTATHFVKNKESATFFLFLSKFLSKKETKKKKLKVYSLQNVKISLFDGTYKNGAYLNDFLIWVQVLSISMLFDIKNNVQVDTSHA